MNKKDIQSAPTRRNRPFRVFISYSREEKADPQHDILDVLTEKVSRMSSEEVDFFFRHLAPGEDAGARVRALAQKIKQKEVDLNGLRPSLPSLIACESFGCHENYYGPITQITPTGTGAVLANFADVQDIWVEYDETNDGVTVTPAKVSKGTTARFKNPRGSKLKIVFLSPGGKEADPVLDSELCTLPIGGTYHFKCFFTPVGANGEISPENGGVIDVVPQRP